MNIKNNRAISKYYTVNDDKSTVCNLCPNRCHIQPGKSGICRNRINENGTLYSMAYGRVCALQTDPIEKKPLLHFHPGTNVLSLGAAGCNLSCLNCQNWTVSQASPADIDYNYFSPNDIVNLAHRTNCRQVAYTYTEPLTYLEYTCDCATACKEAGIKNVLVSAGYINAKPLQDLLPYLDAANIDLKSFSDSIYRHISHAHLQPVLHTLEMLHDAGIWLEITNLIIPTINDDFKMIKKMCHWLADNGFKETPLHFSRFFPQYKLMDLPPTPIDTLLNAKDIALEEGLQFVYIGNTNLPDAENTYCPECGKLLVKRAGYTIEENHMHSSHCPWCGASIPGKWS